MFDSADTHGKKSKLAQTEIKQTNAAGFKPACVDCDRTPRDFRRVAGKREVVLCMDCWNRRYTRRDLMGRDYDPVVVLREQGIDVPESLARDLKAMPVPHAGGPYPYQQTQDRTRIPGTSGRCQMRIAPLAEASTEDSDDARWLAATRDMSDPRRKF